MPQIQQLMASGVPAGLATQIAAATAGAGSGQFNSEGNLNLQISSAGISPAATAADNVLAVYTIPALTFDIANRGIEINAYGSTVSNTNTKTMKLIINPASAVVGSTVGSGGTTIASAAIATTAGSGGWSIGAMVFKYGAAASNTQTAIHFASQCGNTVLALVAPQNLTMTESGSIILAVTGNAATTASDIVFTMLQINMMN